MASIYDKALKRKDFSGTIRKDEKEKDAEKKVVKFDYLFSFPDTEEDLSLLVSDE